MSRRLTLGQERSAWAKFFETGEAGAHAGQNKFNAERTEANGRIYDSAAESKRAVDLQWLLQLGKLSDLKYQVKFLLVPKQIGERAAYYIADFTYIDEDTHYVVEDMKGHRTAEYRLKLLRWEPNMSTIQLRPAQEQIAEQIIRSMTSANESVAFIPGPGLGKTQILLAALTRVTLTNVASDLETVLIATAGALIPQWSKQISDFNPNASVWVLDGVTDKFHSFTPGCGHSSKSLSVLAATTPEEWKRRDPRPSFFLTNFAGVRRLAPSFENWFDRVIEDENFPNMNMDKVRGDLRLLGKTFASIHCGLQ